MIIPPAEARPPSRLAKWTLRILVFVVVTIGIVLLGFSLLSGTSESHRKGFEQMMSESFSSSVQIGALKSFNIFPQTHVDMEDVRGTRRSDGKQFTIKRLRIAFPLWSLITKGNKIEDLQIQDLVLDPGVLGPQEVVFQAISILPAEDGKPPYIAIVGHHGNALFNARADLELVGSGRPIYAIPAPTPLAVYLGDLHLRGNFKRDEQGRPALRDAKLSKEGEELAHGKIALAVQAGQNVFLNEFVSGGTTATFSYNLSSGEKSWKIATLDLQDVIGANPVWAKVSMAWQEFLGGGASSKDQEAAEPISVSIDEIKGTEIPYQKIEGTFFQQPDILGGWWQTADDAACGVLLLRPSRGDEWKSDVLQVLDGDKGFKASLSINVKTGKVSFSKGKSFDTPVIDQSLNDAFTRNKRPVPTGKCAAFFAAEKQ